jgi:hypothetical protein
MSVSAGAQSAAKLFSHCTGLTPDPESPQQVLLRAISVCMTIYMTEVEMRSW